MEKVRTALQPVVRSVFYEKIEKVSILKKFGAPVVEVTGACMLKIRRLDAGSPELLRLAQQNTMFVHHVDNIIYMNT